MMDIIMIAFGTGFFGLTWLFIEMCERLGEE